MQTATAIFELFVRDLWRNASMVALRDLSRPTMLDIMTTLYYLLLCYICLGSQHVANMPHYFCVTAALITSDALVCVKNNTPLPHLAGWRHRVTMVRLNCYFPRMPLSVVISRVKSCEGQNLCRMVSLPNYGVWRSLWVFTWILQNYSPPSWIVIEYPWKHMKYAIVNCSICYHGICRMLVDMLAMDEVVIHIMPDFHILHFKTCTVRYTCIRRYMSG